MCTQCRLPADGDALPGHRMSSKARSSVMELLTTEQSYAKSLHAMLDTYHKPLRNEQFKLKPILTELDIDTIFGNVEDLVVIADDLRDQLEKRIGPAAEETVPRVGDIMCTIAPVLKLYQKYVSHFERAAQRLGECRDKMPVFAQFLDGKAAGGCMPLDSYLIMPVQRIPRYKLLLEEIIKHKPDDDIDQAELQEALRKVKSQAEECNEATRRRENIQKLRNIQARMKGVDLADPNRRFIHEGKLCRVRSRVADVAHYVFYLFDDALLYASEDRTQVGGGGMLNLKRKFNIGNGLSGKIQVAKSQEGGQLIKVVDRQDDDKLKHSWEILASQKSFVVYAHSAKDKEQWLRHMLHALELGKQRSLTSLSLTELAAPVRRHDMQRECSICGSHYKLTIRKVQCTKCSEASCNKCSLEVDRNFNGYQFDSFQFMRCKPVTVHNKEVKEWMQRRMAQAHHVGETVEKVRVCHRCLYGREYNRKNEESYLSWIKAENLFHTQGYLNFRSQPDKQKVIDDYTSREPAKQANGVEVIAVAPASAAALGELAGQYKKCSECKHLLHHCRCPGQPATPRRTRPPFAGAGAPCSQSSPGGVGPQGGEAAIMAQMACTSAAAAAGKARNGDAAAQGWSSGSDSEGTSETWNGRDESVNESERVDPHRGEASPLSHGAMRRVRAWAEFAADPTTHVQLALAEGDVIQVLHEANQDGWGYGINHAGREGYFPMTHVEDLSPPPPTSSHVPLHTAAASGAGVEGGGMEAEGAPSSQMMEPMVAGQHRCPLPAFSASTDDATLEAHLRQAEQKIKAAQQQWELDLKRRTPNAPESAATAGTTKNFFNYILGKPAPTQNPVQNFVPLDIRHIGAGVLLPGASEAAAQASMASQFPSSSSAAVETEASAVHAAAKPSPSTAATQPSTTPHARPHHPPPPPLAAFGGHPPQTSPQPPSSRPSGVMDSGVEAKRDEWACATCTLRNASCLTACAVCGAYKGTRKSEATVSEQEQRLHEQQAMSQRLQGHAMHADAAGPPSSFVPKTPPPPAPHNTVVMPPVVVMHQAPSPPKGDSRDSPGARAMMMADPCMSRPSPPSSGGGQNQQIKNLLVLNLEQLSPGTGHHPAVPFQQQQGHGQGQAHQAQQPQHRPPSATKKKPPPPPPREHMNTAVEQRPAPPPPPAKPKVPPPPIPVASQPRKSSSSRCSKRLLVDR